MAGSQVAGRDFILGRLYYRLGAVYAIGRQDHQGAVNWYDKGVMLLENPAPAMAMTNPGKHGEMFTSMAVSYWGAG